MIMVIDIGNSHIVFALMNDVKEVIVKRRIITNKTGTAVFFLKELDRVFATVHYAEEEEQYAGKKVDWQQLTGSVLSSVVPEVTAEVQKAVEQFTGKSVLVINHHMIRELIIDMDSPEKVGMDLLVDAVAAVSEYEGALAIIDMGTATTFSVVDEGKYRGTIIIPGVVIAQEALAERASQLPKIGLETPTRLIGKNTVESMLSGMIYAGAAMVDGLLQRIEQELSKEVTAIATGGIAGSIIPYCEKRIIYEPELLLKGLWYLHAQLR